MYAMPEVSTLEVPCQDFHFNPFLSTPKHGPFCWYVCNEATSGVSFLARTNIIIIITDRYIPLPQQLRIIATHLRLVKKGCRAVTDRRCGLSGVLAGRIIPT